MILQTDLFVHFVYENVFMNNRYNKMLPHISNKLFYTIHFTLTYVYKQIMSNNQLISEIEKLFTELPIL